MCLHSANPLHSAHPPAKAACMQGKIYQTIYRHKQPAATRCSCLGLTIELLCAVLLDLLPPSITTLQPLLRTPTSCGRTAPVSCCCCCLLHSPGAVSDIRTACKDVQQLQYRANRCTVELYHEFGYRKGIIIYTRSGEQIPADHDLNHCCVLGGSVQPLCKI